MHPIHDFDALLILATALASKRRPAELVEIMAAADLIQPPIPTEAKLVEAFERLARHGLICAEGEGFALTADAQLIVGVYSKKADSAERLYTIKEKLSAYNATVGHAPVLLTVEQLTAAILAHRQAEAGNVKNLFVPKPKPEAEKKKPGQRQRKPMPARKRRV